MSTYLIALLIGSVESIVIIFFLIYLFFVKQKSIFHFFYIFYLLLYFFRLFGLTLFYNTAINSNLVLQFNLIVGILLNSLIVLIFISFTSQKKIFKQIIFWSLFLLIPVYFLSNQLTADFLAQIKILPLGFINLLPVSNWTTLYLIFRIVNLFIGLVFVVNFYRIIQEKHKRKEAYFFLKTIIFFLVFSIADFIFYEILQTKNTFFVSCEITISPFLWSVLLFYATAKYRVSPIDLSEAAENIVSTMPDGLFFLDANHKIVRVNQSVLNSLGYLENELIGESIEKIFNDQEKNFVYELVHKNIIKDRQIKLITKDKREVSFIISGVAVINKEGRLYYVILIAKDAKEIKNYAASRLSKLTPILQKVSQGDFSQTIEIPPEKDEFTDHLIVLKLMIDNFKNLVKEINNKSSQLEYQNEELEKVSSQLQQKLLELERFNKTAVEKELKMIKIKKEISSLKKRKKVNLSEI